MGEIMEVRQPYPYDYVAVFGDNEEIACIPHRGCWLEIVAAPETSHREVNLLLPGQVIRYTRSLFFGERLELPNGKKVGLDQLVGFKFAAGATYDCCAPGRGDHREGCAGRQTGRRHRRWLSLTRAIATPGRGFWAKARLCAVGPCPWRERRVQWVDRGPNRGTRGSWVYRLPDIEEAASPSQGGLRSRVYHGLE
jgi:hypothetical protein